MTRFWEVLQHFLRSSIPRSIMFANVSSVPLLFRSRPQEWPMTARESFSILSNCLWIIFAQFIIAFCIPHNVVKHWHEDDPACEVLWFTLILHHLLNLIEDSHCSDSWCNLPLEFHRLSINSIQFFERIVVRIPLNLLLPGFDRIASHLSLTEYRVGEDVGLGNAMLRSSTVQKACRYTPQILEINHAHVSGFCLTSD